MARNRICIVGLDSYLALTGCEAEGVGGEAIQHALLAHAFRRYGHDVSVVVKDFGQEDRLFIEGVEVVKSYKEGSGFKGLRFLHPRITSLWSAMLRADADIYYQSPAGMLTGLTALFCKIYRRQFIFRIASDANCVPGKQLIRLKRDRLIFELGLRSADVIAAQTRTQVDLLRENYGLSAHIVPMLYEIPDKTYCCINKDIDVLWVSNLRLAKRPELLLDLAESMPDVRFVMVGGASPGSEHLYDTLKSRALGIQNLEFMGFCPNAEVNDLLYRSKVFVNTSSIEGFPNTFLQAWARGVPVVSYFDPDNVLQDRDIGIKVNSLSEMKESIMGLLTDDNLRVMYGTRSRDYILSDYTEESVIDLYQCLIEARGQNYQLS